MEHVPLETAGNYSPSELFAILLRAASQGDSIEQTARSLEGVPTGNGIRYHLEKFDDMAALEAQVNRALQSRLPAKMAKHAQCLAMDLHLLPYYGKQGGTRALCHGRVSYVTAYTLRSADYGTVDCQIHVVCHYQAGHKGQHGIDYRLYVVHRLNIALHQLHYHYRQRFGIESTYRMKNYCRIRTTTKNPVLRLLFVAIAFILVNLWIYLLWYFVGRARLGGRQIFRSLFPLKSMLEFIAHAVERHFPVVSAIYLPTIS